MTTGGVESLSVIGHLDSAEPVVKPTWEGRFLFEKGVVDRYSSGKSPQGGGVEE